MSYSILYRPLFLKVKGNMYIPIYEGGCSNVWECDNKRRSREWYNTYFKGLKNIYCSESELLEVLNNIREEVIQRYKDDEDRYSDERYGYFDSVSVYGKTPFSTSWNDYFNFFKKGFQNAITFEEAKELRISVKLTYYDLENSYHSLYISSEEELFNVMNDLKDKTKNLWVGYSRISDRTYDFINVLRSKKSFSKKGNWIIQTNKGFIKSFEGITPTFTSNRDEALIFSSNKIAAKIGESIMKDDLNWCSYQEKVKSSFRF